MPTIVLKKRDLDRLLGTCLQMDDLATYLSLVKGEIKGYDHVQGDLKIELNDSNRPDLWSPEGIARQIKTKLTGSPKEYVFFKKKSKPKVAIDVSAGMQDIRPYIGGFIARGISLDDDTLTQLIQIQERLSYIFGRKRRVVSIGIYNLEKIVFPLHYKDIRPDEAMFIPLGFEERMDLGEILLRHPKGIEYGGILKGYERYPIFVDNEENVLSFPPIINSREIGEVKVDSSELFVEATGTDMKMLLLVLNILAVNLNDRGAAIEPVAVNYPYDTWAGRSFSVPYDLSRTAEVRLEDFEKTFGDSLDLMEIVKALISYGYQVSARGKKMRITIPPYRDDIMHTVDLIEDYAISRGYSTFQPLMPSTFSVGTLSRIEAFSDRLREYMVGFGFQEVITNILSSRNELLGKMAIPDGRLIEVENEMSLSYSAIRDSILPSLLHVEASSSAAFYPHMVFELGEVGIVDEKEVMGSRTENRLAALIAHPQANFSSIHSYLDLLFYYAGRDYLIKPTSHSSFMEGRIGRVVVNGVELGIIGEVDPKVLENWQIKLPCSVFEIAVNDRFMFDIKQESQFSP